MSDSEAEPMLYLLLRSGCARVVGEVDGWSVAYTMTGEMGRLVSAAPEMFDALSNAVEFIRGSNECLGPAVHSSDREWVDYCVALQKSCESAIAKAKGRE